MKEFYLSEKNNVKNAFFKKNNFLKRERMHVGMGGTDDE